MPILSRKPQAKESKHKRQHGHVRPNQKFYNSAKWRKLSKAYKMLNPLCEIGLDREEVRGVDITDHIVPINQGGAKYDKRNLMSMSNYYHNRKRNLESRNIHVETRQNENKELIPYNRQAIYNLFDMHFPK